MKNTTSALDGKITIKGHALCSVEQFLIVEFLHSQISSIKGKFIDSCIELDNAPINKNGEDDMIWEDAHGNDITFSNPRDFRYKASCGDNPRSLKDMSERIEKELYQRVFNLLETYDNTMEKAHYAAHIAVSAAFDTDFGVDNTYMENIGLSMSHIESIECERGKHESTENRKCYYIEKYDVTVCIYHDYEDYDYPYTEVI